MIHLDDYDPLAWFYDRYWAGPFHALAIAAIDRLLLPHVPAPALLLDVCCGAGHVAAVLGERGYRVAGVDLSREMLRRARANAPGAAFTRADARALPVAASCDGAVSTFDAMNHVLDTGDLGAVFGGVRRALRPGAAFVFDLLLPEAYESAWLGESAQVEDDHVCIVRGSYDAAACDARTEITLFRLQGAWHRTDLVVRQHCHRVDEVERLARAAGFARFHVHHAARDLGFTGPFAVGRAFCVAS